MAISSITATASQAFLKSAQNMRKSAEAIANVDQLMEIEPTTDFNRALIDVQQNAIQTKASAKTIEAANSMLGSLLDVRA